MALKIHGSEKSSYFQRVLVTLAEKNVDDYSVVQVDFFKGEHQSPQYLKLQASSHYQLLRLRNTFYFIPYPISNQVTCVLVKPFGVVPVLQDGDLTLFESRAIVRYLCEKFDGQGIPLYGTTTKERALVNQWIEVESQNYDGPVTTIVYEHFRPVFGGLIDEKLVAEQLVKLEKVLDVYEAHLSKSKYLAGDFISMADLSHLPATNYLINFAKKGHGITSRKHVNAWWEDISSRPSWKKVLPLTHK